MKRKQKMRNLSLFSLTKNDYISIQKAVNVFQRDYALNDQEMEDLIQDAIIVCIEKYKIIKIENKNGFIVECFKNKLKNNISRKKNVERFSAFVLYDEMLREKFAENALDILIRRDQIDFEQSLIDSGYLKYKIGNLTNKQVLCLTTGEIFNNQADAARKYKISSSMMTKHLNGIKKSAGKFKKIKLQWKRL